MLTKKNIINLISKFSLILLILLYDKFCYGYQDKIVAYVNNEIITSFELNSRINLLESLNRVKIHNNQKNEIIELLIDEKLLSQIAKRNGISISENQENFYINDLLKENGFKNLQQFLKKFNVNIDEFKNYIKSQLLLKKLIEYKIEPETDVSKQEVIDNLKIISKKYNNLSENSELKLYEILIYKDSATPKEIEKSIMRIYSLLQKGESFQNLVKQFSQSKTSKNHGFLGWLKVKDLSHDIIEAFGSKIKIGSISTPIEKDDSIIILKIDSVKKIHRDTTLNEQEVKNIIYNQKLSTNLKNFLNTLRKGSYIKIIA
jgi:foldase protein PrsA